MNATANREILNSTSHEATDVADLPDVCILNDDASALSMLQDMLERMGLSSSTTSDPRHALAQIGTGKCRVVLCDMEMPPLDGLGFLKQALQRDPGVYVILMTGFYSIEAAIEAVKLGAYDYLPKPVDPLRLKKTLGDLAELFQQRRRIRELDQQMLTDAEFHGIVGRSPAMLEVFDLARKIARHYTNVLITGPTGTGKELIANAVHQLSPVANQRFAVCNCSAMVDTLLESQLFGHLRGAFTGATDNRPRPVRLRQRRHGISRRSRRNIPRHAGKAAPRDPEP